MIIRQSRKLTKLLTIESEFAFFKTYINVKIYFIYLIKEFIFMRTFVTKYKIIFIAIGKGMFDIQNLVTLTSNPSVFHCEALHLLEAWTIRITNVCTHKQYKIKQDDHLDYILSNKHVQIKSGLENIEGADTISSSVHPLFY